MEKLQLFLFYFCVCLLVNGQVIHVPGDEPTIQAAINASADGDTVLVEDGTYYENINFKGKAITLASWFLIDGNETHIDSTIIDGSQPSDPKKGTVVNFNSGEDTSSVLFGLTITGGTGTYNPNAPHPNVWGAGGIAINSGAKIIYNKIIFNSVVGTHEYSYGGGILIEAPTRPIQIVKNTIANNSVIGVSVQEGGGGGIFCVSISNTEILIANNIIKNNSVVSTLNEVKGSGGGINYTHSSANPNIINNIIFNNSARLGGALKFTAYTSDNNPSLINNTITNNIAAVNGGAIYTDESLTVINSIIWGNKAPNNPQITSNVLVEWSDVEGSWEGNGNIDLDPLFADTINYYLTSLSPCLDAGNPDSFFYDIEDHNNIGFALFPAQDGLRNDMGAFGGPFSKWPFIGFPTDINAEDNILPKSMHLSQNYPNPFNPITKISYSLSKRGLVQLFVYDVLGCKVASLVNKKQSVGNYEIDFNASSLSSGVYIYRLQSGEFSEAKKIILLK